MISRNEADCVVVITTKNRWEELDQALKSIVFQSVDVNCLIVDDGSVHHAPDWLKSKYPNAIWKRNNESNGLVRARNDAALAMTNKFIASIDDDAAFSSPDAIANALRKFVSGVGAVSIRHIDVIDGIEVPREQPVVHGTVAQFFGCAYIVRRDIFNELNGFKSIFVRQGEEEEFCLRMIDSGYITVCTDSIGVIHRPSPIRNIDEMDFYGARNRLLNAWFNYPTFAFLLFLLVDFVKLIKIAAQRKRLLNSGRGWFTALCELRPLRGERTPVSVRSLWLFYCLRTGREVCARGMLKAKKKEFYSAT